MIEGAPTPDGDHLTVRGSTRRHPDAAASDDRTRTHDVAQRSQGLGG